MGMLIAWVAGMVLAALAPAAFAAETDEFPTELRTISRVRLEGRRRVPAKEIWAVLKTRRPSRLPWRDRPLLRLDFVRADTAAIAAVCREHGFLDAHATFRILPEAKGNRAEVRFTVVEGPQVKIREVEWEGVVSVPLDPLRRRVLARAGRPFNPAYLVADTVRIARYYQERGFLPRTVSSYRRDSVGVRLLYTVNEGPAFRFGKVYLSSPGDLGVSPHLIRREVIMKEGEPFQIRRVERSIEHLYNTGLFSQAQITLLPDTGSRQVEFDLRVRERKRRWIDAGVGSGTSERFRLTGEWGHRNLTNHGQQGVLSSRLALDEKGRFQLSRSEASLLEPWLLRTRIRGQVTGYYEERVDRTARLQWDIAQIARGYSLQLRRELGRLSLVSLTQDNSFITQAVTFRFVAGDTLDTPARRDSLRGQTPARYTTRRLQLNLHRDARDNPVNPARGSVQSVIGEVAGGPLKGTSSFSKLHGTLAWYTPTRNGWVFAAQVRGGVMDPFGSEKTFTPTADLDSRLARVPTEDRFRIGGVNSVRGYSENSIPNSGGLAMLQGNIELRATLIGPLGIEFFVDAGNVWTRPSRIRASQFLPKFSHRPLGEDDVRFVFGVGPRLNLPIGPLRLDFTWSLRPSGSSAALFAAPQFAIGPAF
ncbi:MAG: BamA/TamA family outer membrane protein [Candidatus Eisenbacteria bacterium]